MMADDESGYAMPAITHSPALAHICDTYANSSAGDFNIFHAATPHNHYQYRWRV